MYMMNFTILDVFLLYYIINILSIDNKILMHSNNISIGNIIKSAKNLLFTAILLLLAYINYYQMFFFSQNNAIQPI